MSMKKSTFWNSYLSVELYTNNLKEHLCLCEKAFADHKDNISNIIKSLKPTSIAVLGSGYLNDIPLQDLIEENRKVYLVDWIENVSKVGVSKGIICRSENNEASCLFCLKGSGGKYCKNFTGKMIDNNLCTGYEPVEEPFDTCINYAPATDPYFVKADITGGVARNFSERVEKSIDTCKTAKQAFLKAISLIDKLKYSAMAIKSNSIDFVTSSMILSQFDVEPYTFFSKLLENKYGRAELTRHDEKLEPLMEKLRTKLFTLQVECHIKEMYRILKKNGQSKAYLSAELFRSFSDGKSFFLVQDMPKAMEIIGRYFFYEFDEELVDSTLKKSKLGGGFSINQCFVLTPKEQ